MITYLTLVCMIFGWNLNLYNLWYIWLSAYLYNYMHSHLYFVEPKMLTRMHSQMWYMFTLEYFHTKSCISKAPVQYLGLQLITCIFIECFKDDFESFLHAFHYHTLYFLFLMVHVIVCLYNYYFPPNSEKSNVQILSS